MNFRFGAVALLGISFTLAGCAGGGPSAGASPAPSFIDLDNLPQWVMDLPEGVTPRENSHTQQASLYLFQAQQSQNPEQATTRYRSALDAAQAGIEADPENAQSYLQAGDALIGLGDYTEGAAMLDRAEEIFPRYVVETAVIRERGWVELYQEAATAYDMGNQAEALRLFETAHGLYQWRPEVAIRLAGLYAEVGRSAESAAMFQETIRIIDSPQAAEMDDDLRESWVELRDISLSNRAQILFQMGDHEAAAEAFGAIYAEDPDNLQALASQAASYMSAGNHARAQEIYDRLMALPGLSARDYFIVGVGLYESEQYEQAAAAFGESAARVPLHRETIFLQAQSLVLAEDWEGVVEVTERLLEIETHNTFVYRFRARAMVELERQAEAMEFLERYENLPFEVDGLRLQGIEGGYALTGMVFNRTQAEGTEVRLRIHFYDVNGGEVGSEVATISLGPISEDEGATFQVNLATGADVFGYRYEVL